MLTLDNIYRASYVLKEVIRRTDLIKAPSINPGSEIYLKPENLQVTGSFKVRGAYYKISQLTDEEKAKGVIACSAGNHAQGVALAATHSGIKSLICLPEGAPISKVEATRHLGADICLVKGVYDDAYQRAMQLRDEMGYTFVHPFDDELVIAGQGTIGLELLEQLPDVDNVIVPIGGGGLISGVAYAIKSLNPSVKVYGVQASGAPSMVQSFEKHHIECLPSVSTMFNKVPVEGKKTICLVSGGNIDVTILSRVINRGLTKSGRNCVLTLELIDKPGQLMRVAQVIAQHGANILSSHHERNGENANVNACTLRVVMETRNAEHVEEIRKALLADGFRILD